MSINSSFEKYAREVIPLCLFFLAGFLLRILLAGDRVSSWDEADFALAVERFDLLNMQPHFPGYPLFIVPAMLLHELGIGAVRSLSYVSAFFGSFSAVLLYWIVKRLAVGSARTGLAFLAAGLFLLHPALFLAGIQPMSDAAGLFFALLMLWVVSFAVGENRERSLYVILLIGVVCGGIMLGVRLSYFPLAFALLFVLGKWLRLGGTSGRQLLKLCGAALAGGGAVMLWLWPVARTEGGLADYFALGRAFSAGHFQQWGNTLFERHDALSAILHWIAQELMAVGLGGGYIRFGASGATYFAWNFGTLHSVAALASIVLLAAVFLAMRTVSCWRPGRLFSAEAKVLLALFGLPYFAWVLFGQNLDKWRHLIPLYAVLVIFIAMLFVRLWARKAAAAALCLVLLTVLWAIQIAAIAAEYRQGPPVNRLADYVRALADRQEVVVYTWEEKRVLDYENTGANAVMVKTYRVFAESVRQRQATADRMLMTGAVLDGFAPSDQRRIAPYLRELQIWRTNPLLAPGYEQIRLYEIAPGFDK